MRAPALILASIAAVLVCARAHAAFTETLPASTFMLDVGYIVSTLSERYDNDGQRAPLIDTMDRYDPGGGLQGTLRADVDVTYRILAPQLRYGVFDFLTLVVAVPVVHRTTVWPRLSWQSGDYQWTLGRSFTEQDFWEWAASMGQPRPGYWEGNRYTLADMILAARYRFSDHLAPLRDNGIGVALTLRGCLPTGVQKDPEEVVASGTTNWDLHFQGDLGAHLGVDKAFPRLLDDRLVLGLDLFYEALLEHEYQTPTGARHPLLLTNAPYVGETYRLDPGDFLGFALSVDAVPIKGPTLATWLSGHDLERARRLPPLLALRLEYCFTYLFQSEWTSQSALWDWSNEQLWRPGYKNAVALSAVLSLLRLGSPLQVYATYRSLSLIPGKNSRATDVLTVGVRAPLKLW